MVKGFEGAEVVKPDALATRVYPVPALSICRLLKSAIPFELRAVLPVRVPPPGLVWIETMTEVLLAEKSALSSGLLLKSKSCTAMGSPVDLNAVVMGDPAAVSAGSFAKARLHCPVTDTLSGVELHMASLLSRLSLSDKLHVPEAAVHGANTVMSTLKGLTVLLGTVSVTEEAGSAESVVPVGPVAPVMTKSPGAVNVSCWSVSFGSSLVTVKE